MPKTKPEPIDPDDYYFTGQLAGLIQAANEDDDPVSLLAFGPSEDEEQAEGAIVILRGADTVNLFRQWAKRNGVLSGNHVALSDAISKHAGMSSRPSRGGTH